MPNQIMPNLRRRRVPMIYTLRALGLTTSLQLVLDAGDANSVSGAGQTFTDVSPNAATITNGTSTGDASLDLTFTGVAGRQTSGEYLARGVGASGVVTAPHATWMDAMAKADAQITMVTWTYASFKPGPRLSSFENLPSTIAYPGVAFGLGVTPVVAVEDNLYLVATRNDGNASFVVDTGLQPPASGWAFHAVSYNATSGAWAGRMNGNTASGSASMTSPTSSNGTLKLDMNPVSSDGSSPRNLAAVMIWSRALSAAELTALYNATKAKFGL